jgi:hypothetical protein
MCSFVSPLLCVPLQSCGTDGVAFATSLEEARAAFDNIMGHIDVFGNRNESVLVQEVSRFHFNSSKRIFCVVSRGRNVLVKVLCRVRLLLRFGACEFTEVFPTFVSLSSSTATST